MLRPLQRVGLAQVLDGVDPPVLGEPRAQGVDVLLPGVVPQVDVEDRGVAGLGGGQPLDAVGGQADQAAEHEQQRHRAQRRGGRAEVAQPGPRRTGEQVAEGVADEVQEPVAVRWERAVYDDAQASLPTRPAGC